MHHAVTLSISTRASSNLLVMSEGMRPEFSGQDSLADVECDNAVEVHDDSSNPRHRRFQMSNESYMTVNVDTGDVSFEGSPTEDGIEVKFNRVDLNRR